MHIFSRVKLKQSLVAGVLLAFILPAVPALADTTTDNAATVDTAITQTADTGTATVDPTPLPDPAVTDPTVTDPTVIPTIDPAPVVPDVLVPCSTDPTANVNTCANVTNNVDTTATTGNASVADSHIAGDATTGNALNQVDLLNLINSVTGLGGGNLASFITNITGNVNHDIVIDPSSLAGLLAGLNSPCCRAGSGSVAFNTNSNINNDINMNATSGNATVSNNGHAGSATTGDATNQLNLINLINSSTLSGNSFLGIINIFGNLNGNILLPPNFLDMLLASSGPNNTCSLCSGNTDLTINNNTNINNNIVMNATSGDASVLGNHQAGNATTGNATNNLNIFNLTGQQVIGSNDLLVFVNVLGSWFGLIMNAPAGSTMAELGGGVTQTGSCGCDTGVNINNNATINNDITMNATSGDALVAGNRHAGSATTGNATNSANILNIVDSNFNLSGWFGLLFINVFGSWNGNVALQTIPVDPPVVAPTTHHNQPPKHHHNVVLASYVTSSDPSAPSDPQTSDNNTGGHVLGANTDLGNGGTGAVSSFNWILPVGGFCLTVVLVLCGERVLAYRRNRI